MQMLSCFFFSLVLLCACQETSPPPENPPFNRLYHIFCLGKAPEPAYPFPAYSLFNISPPIYHPRDSSFFIFSYEHFSRGQSCVYCDLKAQKVYADFHNGSQLAFLLVRNISEQEYFQKFTKDKENYYLEQKAPRVEIQPLNGFLKTRYSQSFPSELDFQEAAKPFIELQKRELELELFQQKSYQIDVLDARSLEQELKTLHLDSSLQKALPLLVEQSDYRAQIQLLLQFCQDAQNPQIQKRSYLQALRCSRQGQGYLFILYCFAQSSEEAQQYTCYWYSIDLKAYKKAAHYLSQ